MVLDFGQIQAAPQVQLDHKDHKDHKGQRVPQALLALLAQRVPQALLVHKDHKDHKDHKEQQLLFLAVFQMLMLCIQIRQRPQLVDPTIRKDFLIIIFHQP